VKYTNLKLSKNIIKPLIAFSLVWFIFVLYPNPLNLGISLYRLWNPPVETSLVQDLALLYQEENTGDIHKHVQVLLPYRYDWEVYNMPWYFPTLEEALDKGTGDCKARYILFASLLEELDIPYNRKASLTHIWVDYEGKPDNRLENSEEAFFARSDSGQIHLSIPRTDLKRSWNSFYKAFWLAMPADRKIILISGFPIFLLLLLVRLKINIANRYTGLPDIQVNTKYSVNNKNLSAKKQQLNPAK